MNNSQSTQSSQQIMDILNNFGFKFFGYNEENAPLVVAPNGQVVDVDTAYKFLQGQLNIAKSSSSAEANIENSIQFPSNIESNPEIDSSQNIEKQNESLENKIESQENNEAQGINPQNSSVQSSPKISVPEVSSINYSDGYSKFSKVNLDLTIPENVIELESFIKRNAKKKFTGIKRSK